MGRDRLPTVEDEASLPYIHAIVKEVERCHNPFWLGTPHVASENFTYDGKFIPKDTVLVLNTWTMHHDENRHQSPMEFNVSISCPTLVPKEHATKMLTHAARPIHQ